MIFVHIFSTESLQFQDVACYVFTVKQILYIVYTTVADIVFKHFSIPFFNLLFLELHWAERIAPIFVP